MKSKLYIFKVFFCTIFFDSFKLDCKLLYGYLATVGGNGGQRCSVHPHHNGQPGEFAPQSFNRDVTIQIRFPGQPSSGAKVDCSTLPARFFF